MILSKGQIDTAIEEFLRGSQLTIEQLEALPINDYVILWHNTPLMRRRHDRSIGLIGEEVFTMSSRVLMEGTAKLFSSEVAVKEGLEPGEIKCTSVREALVFVRANHQRLLDQLEQAKSLVP